MEPKAFIAQVNEHLSHLYIFARQINELDFAASLEKPLLDFDMTTTGADT